MEVHVTLQRKTSLFHMTSRVLRSWLWQGGISKDGIAKRAFLLATSGMNILTTDEEGEYWQ